MFVCLLLVTSLTFSQKRNQFEQFDESNYFGLHFDDDLLIVANRDEQYTGGLEFEYMHLVKKSNAKRTIFNPFENSKRYFTASFGTQIYTPYEISDTAIVFNDRPFSSYVYSTVGYTSYDTTTTKKLSVDLYFGAIGSELPGKAQQYIHQFGESPPANGWPNKLSDSLRFIPNLRINFQKNQFSYGPFRSFVDWVQIGTVLELNTGLFVNNVKGGIKISGFNHRPQTNSHVTFKRKMTPHVRKSKWKLTSYFMPQIQLVGHNTSLQGLRWIESPHVIAAEDINRFVWALEGGINLSRKKFHVSYLIQARSKEFKMYQQIWHTWAGITIGFSF